MTDVNTLIERYVAMWNEPDAEARRAAIAALWTEEAVHYSRDLEFRGYERLQERVTGAHDRFVGTGENIFVPHGEALRRGDGVRFTWRMLTTPGGEVSGAGCDFLVLAPDGRIAADYQFPEPTS